MRNLTGKMNTTQTLRGNVMTRGLDGKSAYEYAVSKGYEGTEEEFAAALNDAASGKLVTSYNDLTDRPVYEDYYTEWLEQDLVIPFYSTSTRYVEVPVTNTEFDLSLIHNTEVTIIYRGYKFVVNTGDNTNAFGNKKFYDISAPNTGETCYIILNPTSRYWRIYDITSEPQLLSIGVKIPNHKQLDEKLIPDTIARKKEVEAISEQITTELSDIAERIKPDWGQCDENAYSYIKGRTHYTEYNYDNVLVPTGDYTTKYTGTSLYNYKCKVDISSLNSGLIVGNIYKVVFNDVEYLLEAKVTSTNGSVYLGNKYIIDSNAVNTEEPFFIRNDNILLTINEMSFTLSIAEQKIIVHQLDEKYIPDTIARKIDIPCYTETNIIPETRTVSSSLIDADFVQLLFKNRQSAEYLSNDKSFVYEGDVSGNVVGWSIVSEDGTRVFITVHKNSADSVVEDRMQVRGPVLQITVNAVEEIVHQLDEKYIPNKYYTEYGTVQTIRELKPGTIHIDGNSNPDDMEFVQLVLNNRQTTTVEVDGTVFTYKEDANGPEGATFWSMMSEDGIGVMMYTMFYNRILIIDVPFNNTCVITVTHNGVKELHQIDPKYIKDMYYDTSNRVYVNESIDVANSKEVDEGLWNALITGNHENILLDGYHLEMLPIEDPAMHSFSVHEYRFDVFADSHTIGLMPLGTPPSEPTTCAITGYYETGELKQLDEKYIPDAIARKSDIPQGGSGSGVTSWNDLDDKPFYSETATLTETMEFDGYIEQEQEFVQLLYTNRHTATFAIIKNYYTGETLNNVYTFIEDEAEYDLSYGYVDSDGVEHTLGVYLYSIDDNGNLDENGALNSIEVVNHDGYPIKVVVSVDYQGEIHHKLDKKYLPEQSYNDLTDKPFYTEIGTIEKVIQFNGELVDSELSQLVFENRMSAKYVVNGVEYLYRYDIGVGPIGDFTFECVSADGLIMRFMVYKDSPELPDALYVYYNGIIGAYGFNAIITINIRGEIVHKLDEAYLPEHSHSYSYNDLSDKPCHMDYENVEETVLVDLQDTTLNIRPFAGKLYDYTTLEFAGEVQDNDEITMRFEGVWSTEVKEVVRKIELEDGKTYYYIGNPSCVVGLTNPAGANAHNNGLTYCVAVSNSESIFIANAVGNMENHVPADVKVTLKRPTVYKLSEAFLPDNVMRVGEFSYNDLKDRTHYSEFEQIHESRTVDIMLTDKEFAQLLLDNREIAKFEYNGTSFVYAYDTQVDEMQITFDLMAENGDNLICTINVINSQGTGFDTVVIPPTLSQGTITIDTVKETVYKLDSKYISDHAHSYNDLTDRTHYEAVEFEYLMKDQTFVIVKEGESVHFAGYDPKWYMFGDGKIEDVTYYVLYDGVEYAVREQYHGYLGNRCITSIAYEDTGEPFLIANGAYGQVYLYGEVGTHTVSFYTKHPVVKQLDEKYIPDTIARKSDIQSGGELFVVTLTGYDETTWAIDKTIDEIMEAYRSGKNVVLINSNDSYYVQRLDQFIYDFQGTIPIAMFSCVIPDSSVCAFNYSRTVIYGDGTIFASMSYVAFGDVSQLKTQSWEIVGAINELHSKFGDIESICDEVIALQEQYINGVKVTQEGDTLVIQNGGDADA